MEERTIEAKIEEEPAEGGLGAPSRLRTEYVTYAVAALFVLAVAWILLGAGGGPVVPGNQTNGTAHPLASAQAKVLFASLDKMAGLGSHSVEFVEGEGQVTSRSVYLDGNGMRKANISSPISTREIYKNGTQYYFCEMLAAGEGGCALLKNQSYLIAYSAKIDSEFFDAKNAKNSKDLDRILINDGAMDFIGGVVNRTVAGRACSEIAYTIDYGKMSVDSLRMVGLSPDDPSITLFTNYTLRQCLDSETGIPVETHLSYYYEGRQLSFNRTITRLALAGLPEIILPTELIDENELINYHAGAINDLKAMMTCERKNASADKDECFLNFAVERKGASFCSYIGGTTMKDRCGLVIATKTRDWNVCAQLTAAKDDCYIEAAGRTGNASWCDFVGTASWQTCIAAANGTIAAGTGTQGMCSSDAGCTRAGAFDQLCILLNETINVTNSTWKAEYGCYNETYAGCGCVSGVCRWKDSTLLNECINNNSVLNNASGLQLNMTKVLNGTG